MLKICLVPVGVHGKPVVQLEAPRARTCNREHQQAPNKSSTWPPKALPAPLWQVSSLLFWTKGIGCVALHDTTECHLCGRSHRIGFVQNNKLETCQEQIKTFASSCPRSLELNYRLTVNTNRHQTNLQHSRTTSIPRSSLAFSSNTICRMFLVP
jgi:hypothetical protein